MNAMPKFDHSEKPAGKHLVFKILHFFVTGSAGDFNMKTGAHEQFSPSQKARLKFLRGLLTKLHIGLFRLSGGRLGNAFMGMPVLLLTTVGRKTGQPRTLPLFYMQDGQRILLVGSNGGAPSDPVWLLNGLAHPQVSIRQAGTRRDMIFRLAMTEEKARYWPQLTELFPKWQRIEERTGRKLSVALLEPLADSGVS
jgi:deazaflavin-dependent oxidoreductase (nitroreductase family)